MHLKKHYSKNFHVGHTILFLSMAFIAITLICAFSSSVKAESSIIAVTEDLRPLNYEENGEIKGTATDVVRKVLNQSGLKYEIRIYPWARAYRMAEMDENILIFSMNRTEEREKVFTWIGPVDYKRNDTEFFKLRNNKKISVKSIQDVNKYNIGVINKDVNHEFLISKGFKRLTTVANPQQYIKMLQAGRIDLIIGSYDILKFELSEAGLPSDTIESVAPARQSNVYMALSKVTSDEIAAKLKKAYKDCVKSGIIPNFGAKNSVDLK